MPTYSLIDAPCGLALPRTLAWDWRSGDFAGTINLEGGLDVALSLDVVVELSSIRTYIHIPHLGGISDSLD